MQDLYSYGLLLTSAIMFSVMFYFKDLFRIHYGSGVKATLVSNLGGSIFGLIILLVINGFVFEFTLFSLIMGLIATINIFFFSFCSLKALGKINLSLYSLFSMLGGMVLPFVSGIIFHAEPFTLGKAACFVIIIVALCLNVKTGKKGTGTIFYIGVFVFNGLSGVIAKLYQALPFEKISSAGFSILKSLISIAVASFLLIFIKGEKKKINWQCIVSMAGTGILNHLANWLVLVALFTLPVSVQYPFITGGTIIVSTIISLFTDKKPSKREVISVVLAFIGILPLLNSSFDFI